VLTPTLSGHTFADNVLGLSVAHRDRDCNVPSHSALRSGPSFNTGSASPRTIANVDIDGSRVAGCFQMYDPAQVLHGKLNKKADYQM